MVKIMECQKKTEHTAYPVFFDVEPREVRHQSGVVGEAFAKHVRGSWCSVLPLDCLCSIVESCCSGSSASLTLDLENEDNIGRWRNAMKEAAGLAGMELNTFNGHEAEFIQQIVEEVSLKLHSFSSSIDDKLVGMEMRVKDVVSSLKIESDDVRMIGIWGMGGGGKTTLARAVFDHISIWFEGKSFVENVREVSKGSLSGLKKLQKQVLEDVSNVENIKVTSVYDGKYQMKKMMGSIKVLVVLDDVDNIEQLDALAGERNWFKPGSRIIITTRDEQVLVAHRANLVHDVNLLSAEEATCLFSRYAFEREVPNQGYEELSRQVVHYAAGLPLTIKVLGSFLCDRIKSEWEDAIERLKTIPLKETLEKVELSFNGLENDQKEIFLDIACILKGEKKKEAIRILESCGFHAKIGLRVLEQKSLITISKVEDYDEYVEMLFMHDHLEEMGMNIVRRLHFDEPSRHSRLWIREEIEDILVNELGTEEIKCIKLKFTYLHPAIIQKGLKKMKELRFLYVHCQAYSLIVDEDSHYLPDSLQSLCWRKYPFCCLPKTFLANNLEIRGSKVSNLNLELAPNLERLHLSKCYCLLRIHAPVGCLEKLVKFRLGTHSTIERFKVNEKCKSGKLYSAATSIIKAQCVRICPLHPNNKLPEFGFECETDEPGSSWMENLEKLLYSSLCPCTYLENWSATIGGLQHLRGLSLEGSIPGDLWQLESLEKLFLRFIEIRHLPDSICMLKQLKSLVIIDCWVIEQLPEDICRLQCLEELYLTDCTSLRAIPNSICKMKILKYLILRACDNVEKLPEKLGCLECLEKLDLGWCESLQGIPNSICKMKCLKYLSLEGCDKVEKLPEELGCLECLIELRIGGEGISHLPESIFQLKGLRIFGSREQLQSCGFTSFAKMRDDYYVEL